MIKIKYDKFLFACVFFLIGLTQSGAQSKYEDIFQSEQQRFKAQVQQDGKALQLLLHNDLYYLHSNGLVETKADFIASVNSGKITYQEMFPIERSLKRFGKTAIITGLVLVRGLYQGQSFDIKLYYTSVYRKESGRWQLLNWQSTRKPD
ncbi:MAG: nuclear transport factor 2 family protein [Bacteroidota bacterium]